MLITFNSNTFRTFCSPFLYAMTFHEVFDFLIMITVYAYRTIITTITCNNVHATTNVVTFFTLLLIMMVTLFHLTIILVTSYSP